MKRLSLQWRITLMTALLVCATCVLMNCLIGYSGMRYMDSIGSGISACADIDGVPLRRSTPTIVSSTKSSRLL